ncbi:alpha/beta hydrolase [Bacillus carboniphilus]|uniref:Alpha/beta hydrolase n=1 Tax=Bacillus carboniphilus TaxID=86663 RepID=A0ABP3FUB4_9BACI
MTATAFVKPINGTDLYYEYYQHPSSRETIVLIHGFLSSSFSFRHLIPLIKQDYSVLSVDVPPFGKSGKSISFTYSYENMAKTILHLLEELDIDQATVMGHSMGGQIALNIAYLNPVGVKGAVLLCSSSYLKKAKLHLKMSSYIPFFHHYVKLYLSRSGVRKNLQNVVYNAEMINDEMLFGYLQPFLDDEIFKALTRMIRHREGDLPPEKLQKITTPSLLIWGEHDRVVPLHIGKRLNKDLQNSHLVILNDAGHLVPEEKPEEVHRHMSNFIQSIS